jgi:Protein of unknown function (DUF1345)
MVLTPWQVAPLVGWDVTAVAWVGWVGFSVLNKDSADTQRLATTEDDSRAAADALLVSASLASLVGVAFALLKAATEKGAAHGLVTAVAAGTVTRPGGRSTLCSRCDTPSCTTRRVAGSTSTMTGWRTTATSPMSPSLSG